MQLFGDDAKSCKSLWAGTKENVFITVRIKPHGGTGVKALLLMVVDGPEKSLKKGENKVVDS